MTRQRSPERDRAFSIYKENGGKITNREIAKQLGIPEKSVGGWKVKDRWVEQLNGVLQTTKRSTPKKPVKKRSAKSQAITPVDSSVTVLEEQSNLTPKQAIFIEEYLIDFNATRAAIAAGYSKDTAYSIGWNLLRKIEIQEAIRERTDMHLSGLGITQQRVIMEYLKLAFADISNYVEFGNRDEVVLTPDGPILDAQGNTVSQKANFVTLKNSTEVDTSVLSEVRLTREGVSVKMHDKMRALEVLSKYLDLLPDHHRRRIEEEKLKLEQEHLELERQRLNKSDEDEEHADDGFIDALRGRASEVWSDFGDDEE